MIISEHEKMQLLLTSFILLLNIYYATFQT